MCIVNAREMKEARVNAGLNQKELAKECGLSQATICHIESGKSGTSENNLEKIAFVLKMNISDLKATVPSSVIIRNSATKGIRFSGKRKLNPMEVQARLERSRNGDENYAKRECKRALNSANQTKMMGSVYVTVPVTALNAPSWQRDTDLLKAKTLMTPIHEGGIYTELLRSAIKIYEHEGKLYVADGLHRVMGSIEYGLNADNEYIYAELIDSSNGIDDIIDAFLSQTVGINPMTQAHKWRAAIERNKDKYASLREVCFKHDVQINQDLETIPCPKACISPTRDMLEMNATMVDEIYNIIDKLNWCKGKGNPYTSQVVKAFANVINKYGFTPFNKEFFDKYRFDPKVSRKSYFEEFLMKGKNSDRIHRIEYMIGYAY